MSRPRLLDLFCCQGGASAGYAAAGFDVTGIDNLNQPRYPFTFIHGDALFYTQHHGHEYDAISASPPCQAYTKASKLQGNAHERLIAATRAALQATGRPYVIENVEGARSELIDPIMLCGTMFGLRLYRHRLFECSFPITTPLHGQHHLRQVKMGRKPGPQDILQPVGNFSGVDEAREAMGMPWASRDGLREAIPPSYTSFIGAALMTHLRERVAA